MVFTRVLNKTVFLSVILLTVLAATGCSKVLVLPEGAKDNNFAVIEQKRPKSSASCLSCTRNTYAIITAIDGEAVDTVKYDEIRLQPGHYELEVTCGSASLAGGAGGTSYGSSFSALLMKEKGQIGLLRQGHVSKYGMDLNPGSRHWVTMWDSMMPGVPQPKNDGYCLLFTDKS